MLLAHAFDEQQITHEHVHASVSNALWGSSLRYVVCACVSADAETDGVIRLCRMTLCK